MKLIRNIFLLLFSLLVLSACYQLVASYQDDQAFPAPGEVFEVNDLSLHIDCRGEGEPTLVLEAGLTSGSNSWILVHDRLAEITRTCAYDRAGIDWSEPVGSASTSTEVAERLHTLLQLADETDSIVLLGMSAGGVYAREYQQLYPDSVRAMVFVDSSHEQQGLRLPKFENAEDPAATLNICRVLQPLGIIRLLGVLEDLVAQYEMDPEIEQRMLARLNQSHGCSGIYWEMVGFPLEVEDKEPPRSLGELPLLVLSQGNKPEAWPGVTEAEAIQQREVWNELQEELTALSTQSERHVAKQSGHVIQFDQPDIIVEQVSLLLQRIASEEVGSE